MNIASASVRPPRPLDWPMSRKSSAFTAAFVGAVSFTFMLLAVNFTLSGGQSRSFGDFFALWTSAVVTHSGHAAVNFDPGALHAQQVALGMGPHGNYPFPYPPTFLLFIEPLGRLPLGGAYYVFIVPAAAAYLLALSAGRWREWWWTLGACIAPASAITLVMGQTGFLSGALMIGGLRLLPRRPALAGLLFGLLTYKPQLGVLIPVALVAMGGWRAIATATATFAVCAATSNYLFGGSLWGLWAHSITEYATHSTPALIYMPTIYANAMMLGASSSLAWAVQLAVSLPVGFVVWREWRQGPNARAAAILVVGTFLVTPHALIYDMPMVTFALVWYYVERHAQKRPFDLGEIVALVLAFILPLLMWALGPMDIPISWAPLGLFFCRIVGLRALEPDRLAELGAEATPRPPVLAHSLQ